jgi:hypothetical protein
VAICCYCNNKAIFSRSRFWPDAENTLALARFREMAMSELIVLASGGAAFVTGLMIAGMSLIG